MSTVNPSLRGIVQDGKVVFSSGQLPEGTAVVVTPVTTPLATDDDDAADSPETIAAWLRWYDALEPIELTDAERAALSHAGLAAAYGDGEPEYTLDCLKEANPDPEGS